MFCLISSIIVYELISFYRVKLINSFKFSAVIVVICRSNFLIDLNEINYRFIFQFLQNCLNYFKTLKSFNI